MNTADTTKAKLLVIQFAFSNPAAIPAQLRNAFLDEKTVDDEEKRFIRSNLGGSGITAIEATKNVSLAEFVGSIKEAGWTLVAYNHEIRPNLKDPRGKTFYHALRFVFAREDTADARMKELQPMFLGVLRVIAEEAMWTATTYQNPFYQKKEAVPGATHIVVNAVGRQPYCDGDGTPRTEWQKDSEGNRVGEKPLPIKPAKKLAYSDETIDLVPAE